MAWYRTGTVTLTNGNTGVTGAGTAWIANVGVGELFNGPDGKVYEIAGVVSDTSLTLATVYLGTTGPTQAYSIAPTQSYMRDLAASANSLITTYSASLANLNAGKFGVGAVATPSITFAGDVDTGLWNKSANVLAVSTGGVERVTVDAAGAVGIGMTVPVEALHVNKSQAGATLVRVQNDTAGASAYGGFTVYHGATNKTLLGHMSTAYTSANQFIADGSVLNAAGAGGLSLAAPNAAGDIRFYSGGTAERMRLNAVGKLFIGYFAPANSFASANIPEIAVERAQTYTAISARSYSTSALAGGVLVLGHSKSGAIGTNVATADGDSFGFISYEGVNTSLSYTAGAYIGGYQDGAAGASFVPGRLSFFTGTAAAIPTEKMRFDSSGRLGIGTLAPTSKLHVSGAVALSVPTTVGAATYTVLADDSCLRISVACTVTLPAPGSFVGRLLRINNTAAVAIVSATANVYPQGGSVAATAILAGTAGKWCDMQSDGTRWIITASN